MRCLFTNDLYEINMPIHLITSYFTVCGSLRQTFKDWGVMLLPSVDFSIYS